MNKNIAAREKIVGWYSTGIRLKPADIEINEIFRKYTPNPVLVLIDVQLKESLEIPTKSYISIEEIKEVLNTSFFFFVIHFFISSTKKNREQPKHPN